MPRYMLLLYAPEASAQEQAEREAEMPLWVELTQSLKDAGLLVATDRLRPVDVATTVRVRDGRTEVVDGPFAVTKEFLGATTFSSAPISTRRSRKRRGCRWRATARLKSAPSSISRRLGRPRERPR